MLIAYAIFDKKVGRYYRPTFCTSIVEVQRNLEILVKDQNSSLCLFPADFAVYKVGSFDDIEGVFVVQNKPEYAAEVMDYVAPDKRPRDKSFFTDGTPAVPAKKGGKK